MEASRQAAAIDTAMSRAYITRRVHFNAAHRLHNPKKSDEWNRTTYGKCNSPNWHGHNYILEVTVAGSPDPDTGYVLDLGELKRIVNERVVYKCDHANLNLDVDFLAGVLTSTENLAIAFWNELASAIPRGALHAVRLYETERNVVEYRGE
jgi:6-pyruvoyltetrahydropterin/6-carboxytetrahydropterin synthase